MSDFYNACKYKELRARIAELEAERAEAQARALDEFAKKMRAEAALCPVISSHAYGLNLAADKAEAEAKRIRGGRGDE